MAVKLFQRLLEAEPDSKSLRSELITAQIKLAVTRDASGKTDEAVALLTQAEPSCEVLVSADERDLNSLDLMAWLHHVLANAKWKQDQPEEARGEYQKSIKWRERGLRIAPESKQIRKSIAELRLNLAQCSAQLGEVTTSREQFRSAIAVLDEALAHGAAAWGNLCEASRDHDAKFAARCGERSLVAIRTLITSGPPAEVAQYQSLIESYDDFKAVRELTTVEERSSWFAELPCFDSME